MPNNCVLGTCGHNSARICVGEMDVGSIAWLLGYKDALENKIKDLHKQIAELEIALAAERSNDTTTKT